MCGQSFALVTTFYSNPFWRAVDCYVLLGLHGGYITFTVSILTIGIITAVIGDVASHLGCFIFLKDTVNAIAFVALGTSVPGNLRLGQRSQSHSVLLYILT